MTFDEIKNLLALGRAMGLDRLEFKGLVAVFGKDYESVRATPDKPMIEKIGEEEGAPTEDQLLYASCGYDPPLKTETLEVPPHEH